MTSLKTAVIGSGNIGTDLLIKSRRTSDTVDVVAVAGIDPDSDATSAGAHHRHAPVLAERGIQGLDLTPPRSVPTSCRR